MSAPVAMCRACPDEPLVATMAFPGAEFLCLRCGAHLGFLSPKAAEATPERLALADERRDEFAEHAGGKLITPRAWRDGCEKCHPDGQLGESHDQHATPAEWEAHRDALAWLRERTGREQQLV